MLDKNQSVVTPRICSNMDYAEASINFFDERVETQIHLQAAEAKSKHQELFTINMADVMDTRLLLEPVIVQNAALNRNDNDIKKLGECLLALQNENNPQKLPELLNEFHSLLAAATQNDILFSIIHHLNLYSTPFEIQILLQKSNTKCIIVEGYAKVFETVIKRDGVTAYKIMKEYLLLMQSLLNEMMISKLSEYAKMPQ